MNANMKLTRMELYRLHIYMSRILKGPNATQEITYMDYFYFTRFRNRVGDRATAFNDDRRSPVKFTILSVREQELTALKNIAENQKHTLHAGTWIRFIELMGKIFYEFDLDKFYNQIANEGANQKP